MGCGCGGAKRQRPAQNGTATSGPFDPNLYQRSGAAASTVKITAKPQPVTQPRSR